MPVIIPDETLKQAGLTESEARIEIAVARIERPQQKLLEEPGDMGTVPFRRTGLGHRLDRLVLGRKRRRAPLGLGAHGVEGVEPILTRVARIGRFREQGITGRIVRAKNRQTDLTGHHRGPKIGETNG